MGRKKGAKEYGIAGEMFVIKHCENGSWRKANMGHTEAFISKGRGWSWEEECLLGDSIKDNLEAEYWLVARRPITTLYQ